MSGTDEPEEERSQASGGDARDAGDEPDAAMVPAGAHDPSHRLRTALAWIGARERRDGVFGAELFFDPVWNMLLDLYVHHHRRADVSVSSLCIAAKVPPTTALRWLARMEKQELVRRRDDDWDRRRSHVSLTAATLAKLDLVLDRAGFAGRIEEPEKPRER